MNPTPILTREDRPWGWYEVIGETPGSKIKRIHVLPGHKLSLQKHRQREEHWVVTMGTARVVIGESGFEKLLPAHLLGAPKTPLKES